MKLLISLVLYLVSLSVTFGKRCLDENDCDEGQCCVALVTGHLPNKGLCLRLNKNGARCNTPDAKNDFYGGKYLHYCPCQAGLACKPKGLKEGVTDRPTVLSKLRCQKEDTASSPADVSTTPTTPKEGDQTTVPTTPSVPTVPTGYGVGMTRDD